MHLTFVSMVSWLPTPYEGYWKNH
uniref:Uncharacterized protein n=1 Tax=Rhizophora mucronata TaxID=61149 RepID=A0A2P2R0J1_RHIMU